MEKALRAYAEVLRLVRLLPKDTRPYYAKYVRENFVNYREVDVSDSTTLHDLFTRTYNHSLWVLHKVSLSLLIFDFPRQTPSISDACSSVVLSLSLNYLPLCDCDCDFSIPWTNPPPTSSRVSAAISAPTRCLFLCLNEIEACEEDCSVASCF